MFDSFKKMIGKETSKEKCARKWRSDMQAWQSSFTYDESVTPRVEKTLEENSHRVSSLLELGDGRLVSGDSSSDTIKLWDVESGKCILTLEGGGILTQLQDGCLVSGQDEEIRLWNLTTGKCVKRIEGNCRYDDMRAIVPLSGRRLACGVGRNIELLDVANRTCVQTLEGHEDSVNTLTLLSDNRLASGSDDATINLWAVESGKCVLTLEGHEDSVNTLTLLSDNRLASGSDDGTIKLWDLEHGCCVQTLRYGSSINALVQLSDGRLASGVRKGMIKLWDVVRGICVQTLEEGHSSSINALVQLSSGRLASGSNNRTIRLWDVGLRPKPGLPLAAKINPNERGLLAAMKHLDIERQRRELKGKHQTSGKKSEELMPPTPPLSMKSSLTTSSTHCDNPDLFDKKMLGGLPIKTISFDEVTLGRELGQGKFGVVYEGQYNFQKVAVKCYKGGRFPEREAGAIQHEVSVMQGLNHPGLVRFFGLVEQSSDNPAMLVMEHGANGSLYNYLHSSQEISWGVRLRLAEELAQGLAYLHKKKVVHRDIKSLNVVLDRHNHAKWCDFGLATLKLHTLTTSNAAKESAVGTLHWMAPELFYRKTSSPSTRSDIWAFGMLLFELGSREIPFANAVNEEQVKDWIKEGDGEEVPDDCQRECPTLAAMMQRCWVERTARPTAAVIAEGLNAGDQASADTLKTPHQSNQASASSGFVPFSH